MKKVLLRAPVLSRSGYGEHSRQIFKYLLTKENIDLKVQCLHWGATPWYLDQNQENGLVGEILSRSVNGDEGYDVSVQVQLPNEWDVSLAKKNIGVTAGVETDRANPMWASVHAEKMDLVIVPSEHTKKSLLASSSTNTPVVVVPESYYSEILEEPEDLEIDIQTKFNFLTVGVLTGNNPFNDRKNLMFMMKWFIETFKGKKDVGLIVKTCLGRDTTMDRRATKSSLKKVLNEIGHEGFPRVYLLHGPMNRKEMTSLYKRPDVKAFVSLTRGEGFGLPHLEAAAAGLPVIATDWSAHTEFLNLGKWINVDYKLEEIHPSRVDNNIFLQGFQWAFPDEKDFKRKIKNFYQKPHKPTEWALELSQKIITEYSTESINSKYDVILGEYLK